MLVFAIQHANAGRAIELMAGHGVKVAIDILHVDVGMHRALRAIHQHRNAMGMRDPRHLFFTGTSVPSMFDMR